MRELSPLILFKFFPIFAANVACYNILGIFPFPGRSHYLVYDALMVALSERGHNVTIYDSFPKSYSLPNYRQVNIGKCFSPPSIPAIDVMNSLKTRQITQMADSLSLVMPSVQEILNCRPLLDLRNSTEPFDLLITETFHNDFYALFAHVLNVPFIVFHSTFVFPWMSMHAGIPDNPSYLRQVCLGHGPQPMDFSYRVKNLLMYLHALYFYKVYSEYTFDEVAAKFFGSEVPRIADVIVNASMLFLNTHYSVNDPRPMVPNVVEVGGLHMKPAKPLPQNIQTFIDESTHGVIYFSLGSLLRAETFAEDKRNAFLHVFAKLPQRVLWKWEDDLPGQPDNVMIAKWMPQRDIIAHPNVKLFISHGGLLSLNEAVYEGVPILGLPIFADQLNNLKTLETYGVSEILDYDEISETVVHEKISKILNDPEYKKNAIGLSQRFKDRPMSALDTAVYWTEYVLRHKGAHHLKTAAVHMPWYQYFLLDVIAFLICMVIIALSIIYHALRLIHRFFKPVVKVKTH